MRVALLSDSFASGEGYGLGRYARELYRAIETSETAIDVMPCTLWGKPFEKVTPLKALRHVRLGRRRTLAAWQKVPFPPLEWMLPNFNLVHSLELEYPVITHKPWVVTIHDIGPLTHPQFFSRSFPELMTASLLTAVKRGADMICVSETTAQSVQNYLNRDLGEKIRVIHEGVSELFFDAPPAAEEAEVAALLPGNAPFLLVAGSASPRKNLQRVIEAFDLAAPHIPHHLVMTGGVHWDFQPMLDRLERSPFKHRIHRVGYISEEKLRGLYHRASIFLYLSLMEGFGLPLLEAMASGCPILASNLSSMPEIAGGAACLVDPHDAEAIAQGMVKLAEDRAYANELVEKGKARAKQMTWRACAHRTVEVYREMV